MNGVDRVALLALIYREHHNAHHYGPESLFEDFECCPGEVNLATIVGSELLDELDWLLIRAMEKGRDLNPTAAELDPVRAEALLHAWPSEGSPPDGAWTLPYGADRWTAVEAKMQRLRDEGVTASRDDVELVAVAVYKAVTGKNHAAYLDEYADTIFLD